MKAGIIPGCCLVIAAVLLPIPAGSRAAPPTPAVLTEEEAVRLALDRDPGLAAARAEVEAARARRGEVSRPADPELRAGLGHNLRGRDRATETYEDYEIGLRFFPPNPWQGPAVRGRADAEIEIARSRLGLREREITAAVRGDFLRLREVEAEIVLLNQRRELRDLRHQVFRERTESGRSTAAEVMEAASAWLEARQAGETRARERDRIRRRLAARLGIGEIGEIAGLGDLPGEGNIPPEPGVTRPEIAIRQWQTRAAEARVRESRRERLPWFSHAQVAYGDDDRSGRNDSWSARVAVSLPLFSLIHRPDRAAAAEELAVRARLRETVEAVEAEAGEAREAWRDARESHRELSGICRPLLLELRRTLEVMEADPEIELLAGLRLRESLLDTELVLLRSRFEVERARRALEAALDVNLREGEEF